MFLPLQTQIALTDFDAQSVALPHLHVPSVPSASDDVSFWIIGYTIICTSRFLSLLASTCCANRSIR